MDLGRSLHLHLPVSISQRQRESNIILYLFQTTVARLIAKREMMKFGKERIFYICLSKNSNGLGLKKLFEKEDHVTFFNRKECCEKIGFDDNDNTIGIIDKIISHPFIPAHSVVIFDEVPLTSKIEKRRPCYDWSSLKNTRPGEVTAVVCLQPIRLAVTFESQAHNMTGPKDADMVELNRQYRNTTNILGLVHQLRQGEGKLPIEHAEVGILPSHDVQGPEITVLSISDLNQTESLKVWLCNQLQQHLACKPSQVKMIYMPSTKELAEAATSGTVFENSITSINDFQGCETPVAVAFLGNDNNYSQLLEICSSRGG